MTTVNDILKDPGLEKWYRIHILLEYYGRPILESIFYSDLLNTTRDKKKLYNDLLKFKSKFSDGSELRKLYPDDEMTDVGNFDISLFVKVINLKIQSLDSNRRQPSAQNEAKLKKMKSFANKLRYYRNWLYHQRNKNVTYPMFEEKWNELCQLFQPCGVDMASVNELKTCGIFSSSKFCGTTVFIFLQGRGDLFFSSNDSVSNPNLLDACMKKVFLKIKGCVKNLRRDIFWENFFLKSFEDH